MKKGPRRLNYCDDNTESDLTGSFADSEKPIEFGSTKDFDELLIEHEQYKKAMLVVSRNYCPATPLQSAPAQPVTSYKKKVENTLPSTPAQPMSLFKKKDGNARKNTPPPLIVFQHQHSDKEPTQDDFSTDRSRCCSIL